MEKPGSSWTPARLPSPKHSLDVRSPPHCSAASRGLCTSEHKARRLARRWSSHGSQTPSKARRVCLGCPSSASRSHPHLRGSLSPCWDPEPLSSLPCPASAKGRKRWSRSSTQCMRWTFGAFRMDSVRGATPSGAGSAEGGHSAEAGDSMRILLIAVKFHLHIGEWEEGRAQAKITPP
jgi:hypothetical protein